MKRLHKWYCSTVQYKAMSTNSTLRSNEHDFWQLPQSTYVVLPNSIPISALQDECVVILVILKSEISSGHLYLQNLYVVSKACS